MAGDTIPCKDCGDDITVPGGRRRSGGSKGRKGKSKSDGNPALVIGGIVGAVVVVGVIAFVAMRPAAPPPGGFAPNGIPSTIASNPSPPPPDAGNCSRYTARRPR